MIQYNNRTHVFRLETENTTYAFQAVKGKRPIHLYYGKKCGRSIPKREFFSDCGYSFSPMDAGDGFYDSQHIRFSEYPSCGTGDFRSPAMRILGESGTGITEFRYASHRIYQGRPALEGLPHAKATEDCETLELTMKDPFNKCTLWLSYTIYPTFDIIARSAVLENNARRPVSVLRAASLSLDLPRNDLEMISLSGCYYWERRTTERHALSQGMHILSSRRGASGHQLNPFFALVDPKTNETAGDAYAFNLFYSGDFTNTVELNSLRTLRVQMALGDENFAWLLKKGERLQLPEAIMLYTKDGLGGMRHKMHDFVNATVIPPLPDGKAPIVLNTWEGTWFDVDEERLLKYADAAKGTGIDTLVMDDGWFGKRTSDKAGLGDWFVNPDKFPKGLSATIRKVKQRGLRFGIWIEPEMVNPDSDLYRAHPEYAFSLPGKPPALSRNQMVLDMGNPNVVQYLKDSFTKTFAGCEIDYFKWDLNRHLTDVFSHVLPTERQREAKHRFMLGTYELLTWLRQTWPNAILETCSGGGGRYDLGMMVYGHQIWTSDNTDPSYRIRIQASSLLGYPARTMSCHVANRENVCEGAPRTMRFRYAVAAAGPLGYEFNLSLCSNEVVNAVKEQIKEYKTYAHLMQNGRYDEYLSIFSGPIQAYSYATKDDRELLFTALAPKATADKVTVRLTVDSTLTYRDSLTGKVYQGRELAKGLTLTPDGKDEWSFMLHLLAE